MRQVGHTWSRALSMFALVLAGELIFSLPFHLPRYFRPTLLEVFELSHGDFGDIFAAYGIAALLSYAPGGPIADCYPARKLMGLSLFLTAAGGLYLLTIPGQLGMVALYAFWGVTSILLFWAALIRATREWGGRLAQGRGFGLLDAGRGAVAGVVAGVGVVVLRSALGADPFLADVAAKSSGLKQVILLYTMATALAGVVAWRWVPDSDPAELAPSKSAWTQIRGVVGISAVWQQAIVVVCAYCAYKGLDQFSVFAVDVLGMHQANAAAFATLTVWIRPAAALLAGGAGDQVGAARSVLALFAASVASWGMLAAMDAGAHVPIYASIAVTCLAAFGFRGLYFALLEQSRTPRHRTGAAVGLISLAGFSPDIFFGPVSGRMLDATPGVGGYRRVFLLLVCTSLAGLATSGWLHLRFGRKSSPKGPGERINARPERGKRTA